MAEIKARIKEERAAIQELRQRQAHAEREKSLLVTEIESETLRISQMNRTIERAPSPAKRPVVRREKEAAPAAVVPSRAPSAPAFDARRIDAESQAEIDRLSTMKNDLILEKDTLEQAVKQGH